MTLKSAHAAFLLSIHKFHQIYLPQYKEGKNGLKPFFKEHGPILGYPPELTSGAAESHDAMPRRKTNVSSYAQYLDE
jgi:hypothetical protein